MKQYNNMYKKEDNVKIQHDKEEVKNKPVQEEVKVESVKEEVKAEPVKEEVKAELVKEEVKVEPVKEVIKETPKTSNKNIAKVVNCSQLNVRSEASIMASVVEIIQAGSEVETFEKVDDFTKVLTKRGMNGYCMSEYLKEV